MLIVENLGNTCISKHEEENENDPWSHRHYFATIPEAFPCAMLMLRGKKEEFSRNQQDQGSLMLWCYVWIQKGIAR